MKVQQSRIWVFASAAVVFLFVFSVLNIDTGKLYQKLQIQLSQSGITLQADSLNLSFLYSGSARLDNVIIESKAFHIQAQRMFIDLDLAALLTGKSSPQAIYLQLANIDIIDADKDAWLNLATEDHFELNRIDISQSEIHLVEQHLTLENTDLDMRDIGKNRNPRVELRAHVGNGRIDAHGSLRLNHGKIIKGFGRVDLFDIPLTSWNHHTSLDALSGSITSHLNQDDSWQSFGHISLEKGQKNEFTVRAKVTGNQNTYLNIDEMVLNHDNIGGLQVTGKCETKYACHFEASSKKINLKPLLALLRVNHTANVAISPFKAKTTFADDKWTSSAQMRWAGFDLIQNKQGATNKSNSKKKALPKNQTLAHTNTKPNTKPNINPRNKSIHIPPASLKISDFTWENDNTWSVGQAAITSPNQASPELLVQDMQYQQGYLIVPTQFQQSKLWLPLAQWFADEETSISGQGNIDGNLTLTFSDDSLTDAKINLDTTQADIAYDESRKPLSVPFTIEGDMHWEEEELPSSLDISLLLNHTTIDVHHESNLWLFSDIKVDVDQINDAGITLPNAWRGWHGMMQGSGALRTQDSQPLIERMDIEFTQFGKNKHFLEGHVEVNQDTIKLNDLYWSEGKNAAHFVNFKQNRILIDATSIDAKALVLLQSLPFNIKGNIKADVLHLPFGDVTNMSAKYQLTTSDIVFKTFNVTFYEGSLSSQEIHIIPSDEGIDLEGTIQVGGIHLNNWLWLHKAFNTHLEATIYATLNLQAKFGMDDKLASWKGDGDVAIYNGIWLINGSNATADKVQAKLRKRSEFNATYRIKNGKHRGKGTLNVDAENNVSGEMQWLGNTYQISKSWPNLRYDLVP